MKTIVIVSESEKGLFTDKQSKNDLSNEVRKAFEDGAKEVAITETIVNSGLKIVLTGYVERGATSKDSAFKYKTENKEYICKGLREYFGLPLYGKPRNAKFSPCVNVPLATKAQLESEIKRLQDALQVLKDAAKKKADLEKRLDIKLTDEQFDIMLKNGIA